MKRMICILIAILIAVSCAAVQSVALDEPQVSSKSVVLMDQATGQILYEKNAHEKMYPASVTKVMSLLLFMEALDQKKMKLKDNVEATMEAVCKGGSQIWLKEGERMTVDELLRATAIGSANDACTALAVHLSGSEGAFVAGMNEKAASLGMKDTVFQNCTGLDDDTENHLTTAFDIALMSRALLEYPQIQKYTTVWMDSLRNGETQLVNTNKLVRFYPDTTGLKTGTTTKAGCCISASAERNGLHLIAVVMHAESSAVRFSDAKALLDWGFANYESVQPKVEPDLLRPVKVLHGTEDAVSPYLNELSPLLLKKGEAGSLEYAVDLPEDLFAPVEEKQVLGELTVLLKQKPIAKYPLYASSAVRELTIGDIILRLFASLRVRSSK